ncbi:MAG: hypothetical protein WCD37_07570 [Chloroflexia bacterium]
MDTRGDTLFHPISILFSSRGFFVSLGSLLLQDALDSIDAPMMLSRQVTLCSSGLKLLKNTRVPFGNREALLSDLSYDVTHFRIAHVCTFAFIT